jgi:enoyl-CoA hydratase/carnithine racemase
VLARLAALPFTTVAYIEGPCLGVGLELALACDYRLCVSTARTQLGFPQRFTCFGGSVRLRARIGRRAAGFIATGHTLSGREARSIGLVDRACCARRAKIELRTFLDQLDRKPQIPERCASETGLAAERTRFASAVIDWSPQGVTTLPTDAAALLERGFITPLEAAQMPATPLPPVMPAHPEASPFLRRVA